MFHGSTRPRRSVSRAVPCIAALLLVLGCPGGPPGSGGAIGSGLGLTHRPGERLQEVGPPRWLHFAAGHDLVRLRTIPVAPEDAAALSERLEKRIRLRRVSFYEAVRDGRIVAVASRTVQGGLHAPIHFAIYLDREGRVTRVQVIEQHEVRGAGIVGGRFLSQYVGKTANDPTRVGVDVDAITGATVSSEAVTRGVREAVVLWKHFYDQVGSATSPGRRGTGGPPDANASALGPAETVSRAGPRPREPLQE